MSGGQYRVLADLGSCLLSVAELQPREDYNNGVELLRYYLRPSLDGGKLRLRTNLDGSRNSYLSK